MPEHDLFGQFRWICPDGGTTVIAHRGLIPSGSPTNNSSDRTSSISSSPLPPTTPPSSPPSLLLKYPLVIYLGKNEDNSGEYHTLYNPWVTNRRLPGGTRFLAGYPITGPISDTFVKKPLVNLYQLRASREGLNAAAAAAAAQSGPSPRPDVGARQAHKRFRTERRRRD